MGAKKKLKALLAAAEPFAIVAANYDVLRNRPPPADDFPVSVGHFFTTGGSFGPEFSAQVKYTLKEWRALFKACRKARKALREDQ